MKYITKNHAVNRTVTLSTRERRHQRLALEAPITLLRHENLFLNGCAGSHLGKGLFPALPYSG